MCYVYKIDMYIFVKLYFANFHTLDRLSCTLWFPSYFMANVLEAVVAAEKNLVCLVSINAVIQNHTNNHRRKRYCSKTHPVKYI